MSDFPWIWEPGDKLLSNDLNNAFEWLCDRLDLQPQVAVELNQQLSALVVKCENLESLVANLTERIDALEER